MNDTTTTMHFKIIRGDEKRRIELPTPLAFTELRETIATLFSDASTTVAPASIDITLAALNIWKPLKNDKDLARALRFLAPADLAASAASCARWREHAEGEPVWRDACARVGRVTKTTASSGVCESWRAAYRDVVATRFERGW